MKQIDKILCSTDFSNFSEEVLRLGVELCSGFDAALVIFHSILPPRGWVDREIEFERGGEKKKCLQLAREKIKKQMDTFDIKWESMITYGDPVLALAKAADGIKPDIIMAASHGLSYVQQFFLGSVLESMVRTTRYPFLVIPPAHPFSGKPGPGSLFSHIIIACSLTRHDACLKEVALRFSEQFHSTISLVHVMESPLNEDEDATDKTYAPYEAAQRRWEERLSETLNQGLPGTAHILHGVPGEELALFAKTHEIDLIIAGIDPHPGRIIATTTQALLGHLPCAVLAVPLRGDL